jgi:exopolysaccharide biosynthesis polyprenyl glycosylphosphotransferase
LSIDTAGELETTELRSREASVVSDRHPDRSYWLRRLLLGGDLLCISLAVLIALSIGSGDHNVAADWAWSLLLLPGMALLMRAYGLYDRRIRRISHSVLDDVPSLFNVLVIAGICLWLYYRYLPTHELVYEEIVVFGVAATVLVVSTRAVLFHWWAARHGSDRVVLVGIDDSTVPALVRRIRKHREYHLEPLGVIQTNGRPPAEESFPVLGRLDDPGLPGKLKRLRVDRVIVGHLEPQDRPQVAHLLRETQRHGVEVSVLPQLFDLAGPSAELDQIEGLTFLTIHPPVLSRSSRMLKRGLDLAVSSIALLLLAPLLGLIAMLVKLDSPGPALFRQTRIGKCGRRFTLFKFRTMAEGAEARAADLMAASQDPDWLLLEDDPRITRIGSLLRRTSLDELPQLWNILRSDMSLVGPRPLSETDDRSVTGWGRSRLDLVPGLTGLWQVLGRTNIPFEEMVKLDIIYVTNWTLWGDIKLILQTLPVLLTGRGTN